MSYSSQNCMVSFAEAQKIRQKEAELRRKFLITQFAFLQMRKRCKEEK